LKSSSHVFKSGSARLQVWFVAACFVSFSFCCNLFKVRSSSIFTANTPLSALFLFLAAGSLDDATPLNGLFFFSFCFSG